MRMIMLMLMMMIPGDHPWGAAYQRRRGDGRLHRCSSHRKQVTPAVDLLTREAHVAHAWSWFHIGGLGDVLDCDSPPATVNRHRKCSLPSPVPITSLILRLCLAQVYQRALYHHPFLTISPFFGRPGNSRMLLACT